MARNAPKAVSRRIDRVLVQAIVTTYDHNGKPTSEQVTQPVSLFRASTPDVWRELDTRLAATQD